LFLIYVNSTAYSPVYFCVIKLKTMNTAIIPSFSVNYTGQAVKPSFLSRFFTWCANQQHNRLAWLAIALAGHGCIFTPITLLVIALTGINLTLLIAAMVAMGAALVTNLAAMPTKFTIPTLVLSLAADAVIIGCALASL
jgi:hypothetical protein